MISAKEFEKLSKEDKISYLEQIISVFKNSQNLLGNLAKLIEAIPENDISDEFLQISYNLIVGLVETHKQQLTHQELEKLKKISKKISKKIEAIKQKEQEEKLEADKLLENL